MQGHPQKHPEAWVWMSVSTRERVTGQSHFLHRIWQLTSSQIRHVLNKDVSRGLVLETGLILRKEVAYSGLCCGIL